MGGERRGGWVADGRLCRSRVAAKFLFSWFREIFAKFLTSCFTKFSSDFTKFKIILSKFRETQNGDVVAHWRCGGSSEMWWVIRCVLQTTETVVPGSYPASLTLKNSEDRQSHCVYCKISGKRGRPTPEAKFFFFFFAKLRKRKFCSHPLYVEVEWALAHPPR